MERTDEDDQVDLWYYISLMDQHRTAAKMNRCGGHWGRINKVQTDVAGTGGKRGCKGLFQVDRGRGGCCSRQDEEDLTEHCFC